MAAPDNIQLGSLEFDEIKASIISYLQEQDILKDYDYAGSAIQTLVEVLAYNTLYYGHYANMVANEMFLDTAQREESLISLVKPLGYVVPGRSSAKATIFIRGARNEDSGYSDFLPRYTRFVGRNNQGVSYNFYNIEPISLIADSADAGEAIFTIVEGKSLVKENPVIVDSITQKSFISGTDVDISTIRVEVLNDETAEWEAWEKQSNTATGLDDTSKVYWLERTELGFFVVFGGNLGAITSDLVGKSITQNDQVRVSYIKSSGSDGNGVGAFSIQDWTADSNQTLSLGQNGSNSPNLEAIRFFAPKWFAAQDRAVTVSDARAVLSQQGFGMDVSDPYVLFNVWGGEQMDPPMYGRMFVSVNTEGSDNTETAQLRNQALTTLREKTCIGILPEFIGPTYIDLTVTGIAPIDASSTELSLLQLETAITSLFIEEYGEKRYESSTSGTKVSNQINALNSRVGVDTFNTSSGDFQLNATMNIDSRNTSTKRKFYFRNPMESGTLSSEENYSGAYGTYIERKLDADNIDVSSVSVRIRENSGVVTAYYLLGSTQVVLGEVGSFDANSGVLELRDDLFDGNIRVTATAANRTFYGRQEIICNIGHNIAIQNQLIG